MKYLYKLFLFLLPLIVFSQTAIEVSNIQGVTLEFTSPIKEYTFSKDAPFFYVSKKEQQLTIEALKKTSPTKFSVETLDQSIYRFTLVFSADLKTVNHPISLSDAVNFEQVSKAKKDKPSIALNAEKIFLKKGYLKARNYDKQGDVRLKLQGIWVKDENLFFKFDIKNNSNIDYDVENIFLAIENDEEVKDYQAQEHLITSIFEKGNLETIKENSHETVVLVFPKFTTNSHKSIVVSLNEINGDRNLLFVIPDYYLLKAKRF